MHRRIAVCWSSPGVRALRRQPTPASIDRRMAYLVDRGWLLALALRAALALL
jgi:hypothetical protein